MNATANSENPLLEGLSPFIPVPKMPAALFHEPLAAIPWRTVTPETREQYLEFVSAHFVPTTRAVDIAVRLQCAILSSLARRNPLAPAEQKRINQLALLNVDTAPDLLPALANPAAGAMLAASTGMGKSTLVKRSLQVIAPEQVITHSRSEACGWSKMVQIAYLTLDFPQNGTRGGLVERILAAVDQLVGTDYSARNHRLRNLDHSLVLVMKVLSIHRVGLLVLDEMQSDNFDGCQWHREFVLYLLCLLNLGVPVMLCGQPDAFIRIKRETQTLRRFSTIGNFTLNPVVPDHDEWWVRQLVPGIMRFNLCEEIEGLADIARVSLELTGGVPGFFACAWKEAQRLALRRCGRTAKLTFGDFESVSRCEAVAELMQAARANGASGVERSDDVPAIDEDPGAGRPPQTVELRTPRAADRMPSLLTKTIRKVRAEEKRMKTRAEKKATRAKELSKILGPDDVRMADQSLSLIDGLDTFIENTS